MNEQHKNYSGKVHPWRRFFARVSDYSVLQFVFLLWCLTYKPVDFPDLLVLFVQFFILRLFWEALFISLFGTTPGKWLLDIRVTRPDGKLLSFWEAFGRSYMVLFYGEGFGIPPVSLFTNMFSYSHLTKTGTTRWDAATNAVVSHKEWGVFRALVCTLVWMVSVFFAITLSSALGSLLGKMYFQERAQQNYEQSQFQSKQDATQGSAQINTRTDVRQLFEKASKGDAQAQNSLGVMYCNGEGVRQDYKRARSWFEKAAAQGYAKAQVNLGVMYAKGQGVRQDYARARSWYEKAAAQGNAEAIALLGAMHSNGKSVRQNRAQARKALEESAEQGNVEARFTLCMMYDLGQGGVQQDKQLARKWCGLACDAGVPLGCDAYQELRMW